MFPLGTAKPMRITEYEKNVIIDAVSGRYSIAMNKLYIDIL